jgi:hypothetical protein
MKAYERTLMSYEIVKNIYQNSEDSLLAPVKDNGSGYRYAMYYNGFTDAAFSDSHEELLSILLPGYAKKDEASKMDARIILGQNVASQVQAEILAELPDGYINDNEFAVLTAPRGLRQPEIRVWTSEVPLVAVETSYKPYTNVPRPVSSMSQGTYDADNLWWIRPVEEEDFLVSLHEIGYIRLLENTNLDDF